MPTSSARLPRLAVEAVARGGGGGEGGRVTPRTPDVGFQAGGQVIYLHTLMIYEIGFNQDNYTFTLVLLINIVLCSKFPWTEFINYKCIVMRLACPRADNSSIYLNTQ